jgi:HEAT repeat protein/TolA-binding protein
MKRVCLFVGILLCSPLIAAAQAPTLSPVPPTPPTAPAPRAVRVVEPVYVDSVAIEDAIRASQDALRQLDLDALVSHGMELTAQRLERLDVEELKAQTKEVAKSIDVEKIKEEAKAAAKSIDVEAVKAQAKEAAELAKQSMDFDYIKQQAWEASERAFELKNFAYDFQDRGPEFQMRGPSGGAYDSGLSYIQRRQYEQAITRFDQAIAQKGPHADGALYWKAFAQWKLGKTEDVIATLNELRRSYAQSRYLADARVLEADVRKSPGDASDDEIKLLAIAAMQNTDPDRAVPLLENVLKASNTLQLKKKALFVLAQNDRPAAHQILVNYAKGSGNPDLQIEAIRYLSARKQQTTANELQDIYNSTQDVDVRRAVLDGFANSGNKVALVKFASDPSVDTRRIALNNLGNANLLTPQELMGFYQKEENKDLRMSIVRSLGSMQALDQLAQVIKTEKDPAVRQQAIRSLGNIKADRTGQTLVDLYSADQDRDSRRAVLSALSNQNNAEALVAIARKETNGDMKLEIFRKIADLAPKNKAAMDYLMEQIK